MKKILFGILAIFLLAVIGTVSAATFTGSIPVDSVVEDVAESNILDLDDMGTHLTWGVTCQGVCTYAIKSGTDINGFLSVDNDGTVDFLAPANKYGVENVIFVVTDTVGSSPIETSAFTITVTNTNDAPVVTDIPSQPIQEGATFATINLDSYVSDVDNLDSEIIWTYSGNTDLTVSITNRVATITIPSAEWNDAETITFKATDPSGLYDDDSATFTVTAVDDPLTVSTIPDQKWTKDTPRELDLKNYFSDPDDTLTYLYTPTTLTSFLTNFGTPQITNGVITFRPISSTWKGTEKINFTATSTKGSLTSNEVKLVVREKPDFVCEDGEIGDLTITSIEDPDNTDKFKPGEEIPIKVKVHNDDADEMDVVVKAFLYYESGDDIIENAESDSVTIDSDDTETIEFNLVVPSDQDVDEGNYVLYLKAYEEDGNENNNCVEDSVDVEVNRDTHDVIISKLEILPLNPKVGDDLEITVSIENIGTTREDDVTVKIVNTELGLNLVSEPVDLKKYDSDENDKTLRFTFKLPSNIAIGGYDIDAVAYNDDNDAFDASDDAEKLVSITLTAGATTTATTTTTTGATTTTTTGATTTSKWTDVFGSFEGSKVFWIIGDIILVIVAIFFIKLIFSGRRRPVKEARL